MSGLPVAGRNPTEPHGYLTGDYPHFRLCCQCGFRLWRTRLGEGKADAGVGVVLFCKDRQQPSQPDAGAGGTMKRKAT